MVEDRYLCEYGFDEEKVRSFSIALWYLMIKSPGGAKNNYNSPLIFFPITTKSGQTAISSEDGQIVFIPKFQNLEGNFFSVFAQNILKKAALIMGI